MNDIQKKNIRIALNIWKNRQIEALINSVELKYNWDLSDFDLKNSSIYKYTMPRLTKSQRCPGCTDCGGRGKKGQQAACQDPCGLWFEGLDNRSGLGDCQGTQIGSPTKGCNCWCCTMEPPIPDTSIVPKKKPKKG